MKQYLVIFQGDTNDADYIHKYEVLNEEQLKRIQTIVVKILNHPVRAEWSESRQMFAHLAARHDFPWPTSHYGRRNNESPSAFYAGIPEDEIEELGEYLPHGEFGIHTAEIHYYELVDGEKKWIVDLVS